MGTRDFPFWRPMKEPSRRNTDCVVAGKDRPRPSGQSVGPVTTMEGKDTQLVNPGNGLAKEPPDPGSDTPSEPISAVIPEPRPGEALAEDVEGRAVTGPDDGFGKLWHKQFWIRLEGVDVTPEGLVKNWKDRYTEFWPKGSHLYQPSGGLEEGDTAAADLAMIG